MSITQMTVPVLSAFFLSVVTVTSVPAKSESQQAEMTPGQTWKTLTISSVRRVEADESIPSSVAITFENGGGYEIAEGVTLTINGGIQAPSLVQIFHGKGKVLFTQGAVSRVYPQWWGAVASDDGDDTTAIQAAIDSRDSGGTVYFPSGIYHISSRLTLLPNLILEGAPVGVRISATKSLSAMLQRPDLTPPPEGIHFNKDTRVDAVRIKNIFLRGNGSTIGLDLTNVNYTTLERVSVDGCKTGIMMAQLGMYETFVNVNVAFCETGIELNQGTMNSNFFGGIISGCNTGILINTTGHLNIYGITFDGFKKIGVDIRAGDQVNLHYPWFDSVKPATSIRIASKVNQCSIVNPRYSGPTPKEIINESDSTLILDASFDAPTTLRSSLLKTATLYANGISGTDVPARNLRGQVTISGAKRYGEIEAFSTVTFETPEPDPNYFITATCVSVGGDVPAAARRVFVRDKSESGFDVCLEEAPGGGNSVEVDWMLIR